MVSTNKRIKACWPQCAVMAAGLFLAGCGGGGTDDDVNNAIDVINQLADDTLITIPGVVVNTETAEEETPVTNAGLSGRVVDAVSGLPLAGVTVTLFKPDAEPVITNTDVNGIYNLSASAGAQYSASFTIDGYLEEQYSSIDLVAEIDDNLGTVRLVSNENSGAGELTGTISNAVDGFGVAGLTLRFRPGINATTGEALATATTDTNGVYTVTNLTYGNWTCEIVGVGFDTTFTNVIVLGNITQVNQNSAVSPNLGTGEIRIVLTWGSTPSDLDSHLTGPQENSNDPFHVYFSTRSSELASLDVDDVSSFGPETITIERQINGVYRYSVFNFSDNNAFELSDSGASVQVFDDNGLIRDYRVPDGVGNLWTVFEMEGGNITTVNTISELTSPTQYFPVTAKQVVSADYTMPQFK